MKRRIVLLPAGSIVLIGLFVLFFTDLTGLDLIPGLPELRFQRTTIRAVSGTELAEIRDLSSLNTVAYVHRAVFPFDYLDPEITMSSILARLRTTTRTVRDTLSEREYLYFQAWNLMVDVGMNVGTRRTDFIVLTVVVTAGIELGGDTESRAGIQVVEALRGDGSTAYRAIVSLPPATITGVTVEDLSADYPYPDVPIGADGWRRVADFVAAQVRGSPEASSLLATATERARGFVATMLSQAGYDEVTFE